MLVSLFVLFQWNIISTGYHPWALVECSKQRKDSLSLDLNYLLAGNYESLVKLFNLFPYQFSISKIEVNFTARLRDYEKEYLAHSSHLNIFHPSPFFHDHCPCFSHFQLPLGIRGPDYVR